MIANEWDDPAGVPISAILFGGRRSTAVPLINEAYDWNHGVYLAANLASEGTAAAENAVGALRRDPFAMLPFCGYDIADYFAHWLRLGTAAKAGNHQLPRIFIVNWFRKNAEGKFVWPGFGENIRALKWITQRIGNSVGALDTPIGRLPLAADLDLEGLGLTEADLATLLDVDGETWRREAGLNAAYLAELGAKIPAALLREQARLEERLVG